MTVFVLGGGVAGIAAALAAIDRGERVVLYESRRQLGGRAFSFDDRRLRTQVDNGPHVMLGCYEAMRTLLRRLGTESLFERPDRLQLWFREVGGGAATLRLSRLPVRLALPLALIGIDGWTIGERTRALRGLLATLQRVPSTMSFEDWLLRHRQQGAPRRFLWEPLCLAVMNAPPDAVSAALFVSTLRAAFRGSAAGAAIWIPRAPWSKILDEPARSAIGAAGSEVVLGGCLRRLQIESGRVTALGFASTPPTIVAANDIVVSALPWDAFARAIGAAHAGASASMLGLPIVNVVFDYGAAAPLPQEGSLVALIDGAPFQFVFRRPGDPPGRFTLIAGAADGLAGVAVDDIVWRARQQLQQYYPLARLDLPVDVRVTKEPRATLLASPDLPARRPPPGAVPGVANLWICGDWTQTGLPSTLEGAARSAALLPWDPCARA